jgi:hypothetical protein
MMNDFYDILEACLQGLDNGAELESLLARYPEHAAALRPSLEASIQARRMAVSAPPEEVLRRGRAKFLQHAAELRERKSAPIIWPRRVIPIFQRLAITLGLTAVFLASGTGLVSASSSALPGENLYPVKRSWEDVRLFFTFREDQRISLESEFENERLQEVSDLITEGRDELIQFSGVYMEVKGVTYVSGLQVLITENTLLPAETLQNGAAVVITGHTNSMGLVEAESIELLPEGATVPVGPPIEEDSESDSGPNNDTGSEGTSGRGSENEGQQNGSGGSTASPSFQIDGDVDSVSNDTMTVDGQTMFITGAEITGEIKPGVNVDVEGYYAPDGQFIVTKVKVNDSNSGSDGNGGDSGSNSGSGSSGSGSDDGGGDDHGGGSGSGGGDGGGGGGDD